MRGEIRHLDDENIKLRRNFDRIRAGFEEQAQLVEVGDNRFVETPGGCFTKIKIYFKLDLTMAGRSLPLFDFTIYWHCSLKGRTNHGHKSTEFTFLINYY